MPTFDEVLDLLRKAPILEPGERTPGAELDPATKAYLEARDQYDREKEDDWLSEVAKRLEVPGRIKCTGILQK